MAAHHLELPAAFEDLSYPLGCGGPVAETEAVGELPTGIVRLPQHLDDGQVVHDRKLTTAVQQPYSRHPTLPSTTAHNARYHGLLDHPIPPGGGSGVPPH